MHLRNLKNVLHKFYILPCICLYSLCERQCRMYMSSFSRKSFDSGVLLTRPVKIVSYLTAHLGF
jgi:hypothetical protein